ncbi:hypothetical protein SAMN06265348_111126 [Pedobacter westerhofensis]|uniref:Uncharacterized protein n=1 Tax=Pedobacter westerhofensis TaxID=425512 RepID=A0A521FCG5_9SPHI|nr:hypothetical protein [Pedobacter westerhofensis]SMO93846.1 hypothetical protein SAMN06265348_111126 [Pedobacter westerhofensis]
MKPLKQRVTELEKSMSLLVHHMQDINHSIATGFEKLEKNFSIIDGNFSIIQRNFSIIEDKFNTVNGKIDSLRGNSTVTMEIVENKLDDLKAEIIKINDVTGYSEMTANNSNLKIVKASSISKD